jgi:hypothetical protein
MQPLRPALSQPTLPHWILLADHTCRVMFAGTVVRRRQAIQIAPACIG